VLHRNCHHFADALLEEPSPRLEDMPEDINELSGLTGEAVSGLTGESD